jgi:YHS domain-containing protein
MQSDRTVSLLLLGISVFALSSVIVRGQTSTQSKSLVNIDSQGIAAHGYDPVAFFTEGKANKGDSQWRSTYGGAAYYFQSNSNREMFDKDPAKYAPQYGGYCAMSMTMGKLEDVDPNYFVVHGDKLLLQHNEKAYMMFSKDVEGNIKKADANWAKLQQPAGK